MTAAQKRALARLAGAFKACGREGIAFFGMDDTLIAYDKGALMDAGFADERGRYDGGHSALHDTPHDAVDVDGTYLGSGGW